MSFGQAFRISALRQINEPAPLYGGGAFAHQPMIDFASLRKELWRS
jgi:hypothetical protein